METKAGEQDGLVDALATSAKAANTLLTVPKPNSHPIFESTPDPDEDDLDDLDDLDDMLEEFSTTKLDSNEQTPGASGPGRPLVADAPKDPPGADAVLDDDFAKQLQAGMADLLGEMQTSPEMQSHFENMLKEIGSTSMVGDVSGQPFNPPNGHSQPSTTTDTAGSAGGVEESFQKTIKKTMERMQASGEQATAAAASDDSDDILAELMKQMQAGAGFDGEGSEEDFSKMLLGMMEQLTNKEILYEPMKELDDKFPEWMEKNKAKTPAGDMKRYDEQRLVVREIVAKFEEKTYSDSNVTDREYIVERMQKMQAAGSPPPDLVGDMASAQEAFGAPEEGCPQQ